MSLDDFNPDPDERAEYMTYLCSEQRFQEVRELRVGGATWRKVADVCGARWGTPWGFHIDNQGIGNRLCDYTAEHFGEDPFAPPWN